MANEGRPQLLPEKFDGSENFDDWVSTFECISEINGWNEREKALWLRAYVKGKAHVAYQRLSHETRESYKNITIALRNRFKPERII